MEVFGGGIGISGEKDGIGAMKSITGVFEIATMKNGELSSRSISEVF